MKTLRWAAVVVLLLVIPVLARGQSTNAAIAGRITDPAKATVPKAKIEVINTATNVCYQTETDDAGSYVVTSLPPGNYRIEIEKQGFQSIVKPDLVLHTQDVLEINFELRIGSSSQTITVTDAASPINTSPAVSMTVTREFVENVPLNGRSFQDLIALTPGAVTSSDTSGLFSVNGQRDNANYFTVDGVAANLNPVGINGINDTRGLAGTLPSQTALGTTQSLVSVDALEEFKIQTSGYSAEYGRQPGGQVSLTTRSGTNVLHGSLFDYFRNEVLDANSWSNGASRIPKQAERQNDFGGTIGGPLVIPRIYDGVDKTFYFASYEGLRLTQPQFSGVIDVPTLALRQFAASGVQSFLNSLPVPKLNTAGNGDYCLATLGPAYQAVSCTAPWSAGYSNPSGLDALNLRADHVLSRRFRLFLRYADSPSEADVRTNGSAITRSKAEIHSLTLGSTGTLSSTILNEFRFNYTNSAGVVSATPVAFQGAVPYPKQLVIPPQYAPAATPSLSVVILQVPGANAFPVPAYFNYGTNQHQHNLIDSVSWTKGNHGLKFGVDYRHLAPLYNPIVYQSEFVINSEAAVEQGFANSVNLQSARNAHPVFENLSLFGEDVWRLGRKLTLNYGVRWDLNPAPGAADGAYPLALTTSNFSVAQIAPEGTPQYHTSFHDFAPRIGFAYDLSRSGAPSLVIRGSFGIFYDTAQSLGANGYAGYPFQASSSVSNIALPATPASIAPPPLNAPLTQPYPFLNGITDPNLKLPYTEQWNLSVDRGLTARNTLTLSYVGNAGKKLLFTAFYLQPGSVNPAFTGLLLTNNAASSAYHALQLQDQGYIGQRLQLVASFAWAHAIDNASSDSSSYIPLRGNSDNDVRVVLNGALNYSIPSTNANRFLAALTKGWSLANRISAQTGYPIDVNQGQYTLPDGIIALIRPDLVPHVPIYLRNQPDVLGGWELNKAAFSPVPLNADGSPVRTGNLGRNYIHGPGFWNLNTAAERTFPLHERLTVNFRLEAFNILNHPNAGGIDLNLLDSTFGQSNGFPATIGVPNQLYATGAARSLQLSLKLLF